MHFLSPALFASSHSLHQSYQWNWTTHYYSPFVDNFNFNGNTSQQTFSAKWLMNDTFWTGPPSPIFFYTGNEGEIELFLDNAGFMFELATEMNALVVAAEHRYFGVSMPFGNESYTDENIAFLSIEQALADYAFFITDLQANLSASTSPVISFGGSYGGMLSAWFRYKYPSVTQGAIAASAPILQTPGLMDPGAYNKVITDDFRGANPESVTGIYNTWNAMLSLGQTQAGRDQIQSLMNLCNPLNSIDDVWETIYYWSSAIGYMAMADYPYEADFLGPMPAFPVTVAANVWTNGNASDAVLIRTMADSIGQVFFNYTGQAGQCFNTTSADPPGVEGNGWGIICCKEVAQPIGSYGLPNDFFWDAPFDLNGFISGCQGQFNGLTPRPYWISMQFGGAEFPGSNVVFSNGQLDPWKSGGILTNSTKTPSVIALMHDSAHHADLRSSNVNDTAAMIQVRNIERASIKRWVSEFYEARGIEV
jgi:lysosomal Pro-X carboxypeptidase